MAQPLVPEVAGCLQERDTKGADSDTKPGHLIPVAFQEGFAARGEGPRPSTEVFPTLQSHAGDQHPCVAFNARQDPDTWNDRTGPIDTDGTAMAVAFSCKDHGADAGACAPTLRGMGHADSHANGGGQIAVATSLSVRRLTPRECERLQGFPDDYTLIAHRGKPAADGPRYKALGNSMAVPVMRWIGEGIEAISKRRI